MQTSLIDIERKSTKEPKHRFGNLYGLLNRWNLSETYRELNKQAASGVDGVSVKAFKNQLATETIKLEESLRRGSYRTKLVKRVYIDKANGKKRPLGIPVVRDRLLQSACSRILTSIYEPKFMEYSFGYRKSRGAKVAVEYLSKKLNFSRVGYVLEMDIKGFFDNMDHNWMIKMLELHIEDRKYIKLIEKWLKSKILNPDGTVEISGKGTPQGGVISPVLANIYLHYVLDLWFEKKVKPHMKGEMIICRYADDTVCTFQYKDDAERVKRSLERRLAKFGLELSKEKTKLTKFTRFNKRESGSFDFLGFTFRWATSRNGKDIISHKTRVQKSRSTIKEIGKWIRASRNLRMNKFFKGLNDKLRGHYNYFGVVGNMESLQRVGKAVKRHTYKWLNRRSQKKSFNWRVFEQVWKRYEMVKPFINRSNQQIRFAL
jgi:group II intron reverse transcriptase/maturase